MITPRRFRRRRPPTLAPPVGALMPDGSALTGCTAPPGGHGQHPWLRAGDQASSVDDHGHVRLWSWHPVEGWRPDCDGEAQPARRTA